MKAVTTQIFPKHPQGISQTESRRTTIENSRYIKRYKGCDNNEISVLFMEEEISFSSL